ncbi:MAG: cytidylate kinase family protein [Candidatus Uhrbacteria bacterium]
MIITISGTAGSGKSTLARILAKRLGYPHLNAGQIFREAAIKRRMALPEFGAYVNQHPEIDQKLDATLIERARRLPSAIIEGRLAGWMTKRMEVPAFRIWITAREGTRVNRLMEREGENHAETLRLLRERSAREREQYRRVYGLDLSDLSPYDLIIKTDDLKPEQIVRLILTALGSQDK